MQSQPQQQPKPPLYKEFLVGILVGGLLGPVVGWFVGTFATFFAVTAMDTSNVRGMRTSGFVGGLIGIPIGLVTGLAVSVPLRLLSSQAFAFLKIPWFGSIAGATVGWLCGYLILRSWYPSSGSLIYMVIVCMVVGGVTGSVAVIAKPKWLCKTSPNKSLVADGAIACFSSNVVPEARVLIASGSRRPSLGATAYSYRVPPRYNTDRIFSSSS